jgi:two-component system, OmpR family, phosphate regulon sensor histidine kinase PhoR
MMGDSSKKKGDLKMLAELNDELENYFSNTIIPQLFVDADMILRKFTPAAMTHFDLSDSDVGRHIDEVSNNIRYPTIIDNIQEVIASSESLEKEIQTTDKVWYQMNILPYIIRKENRTNGVIITFVDINNRIQILKGYEKLNRNYEVIIHALYHDIKGPVTNIEALVKMVDEIMGEEGKAYEEAREVMERLNLSVAKLRETVEDLVDIGESEKDFAKAPERVNFGNVIEDAILSLREKIAEADAKVTSEINEEEINISRKTVRSIIYNLLSNAIKYKSPDRTPEVRIRTEKVDGFIILSISDNGLGIREEKKQAIFNRYTRLRDDVEGTGIGLFIVKNMVEDMGGKIEVESIMGEGTTFKVFFRLHHI